MSISERNHNHWVALRLRLRKERLWVTLDDDRGTHIDSSELPIEKQRTQTVFESPGDIVIPEDLESYLTPAIEDLDRQYIPGLHQDLHLPATLPVFAEQIAGGPDIDNRLAAEIVAELLDNIGIPQERLQIIELARHSWFDRTLFRLPLRILTVGDYCNKLFNKLRSHHWYSQEKSSIEEFGVSINQVTSALLPQMLAEREWDVLVIDRDNANKLYDSETTLKTFQANPPHLTIAIRTQNEQLITNIPNTGTALLCAISPYPDFYQYDDFISNFFYGIIHDLPLHEATRMASKKQIKLRLRLIADPASNQSLRLSDEFSQLIDDVAALGKQVNPGNVQAFLPRLGLSEETDLVKTLRQAASFNSEVKETLSKARNEVDFAHESRGLVPLAKAELGLQNARLAFRQAEETLRSISTNRKQAALVKKHQERRVDVTLDHLENGFYQPYSKRDPFLASQRYRLGVHIGQPSQNSLMVGKNPPIDPLLPPSERPKGYHLDIVVFEKDFELLSERVRQLYLPDLGGSEPVYFELRAPKTAGPADLRISVYYRNHLIQSFRLEARVSETWVNTARPQVRVHLDFCRTARFTNLRQIKPRALSIGVNQNQNGTHTFMIKKDQIANSYPIELTEAQIQGVLDDFRGKLKQISENPLFSVLNTQQPVAEFEKHVRELAKLGGNLYHMLFQRASKEMQSEMRLLRNRSDQSIQIIRHDINFSFPWTAVYDYRVPDDSSSSTLAPICMGKPLPIPTSGSVHTAPQGLHQGCPHNPGRAVYCIEGFWGVRHRVEQLIGNTGRVDGVHIINMTGRPGSIGLAANLNDPPTQAFRSLLHEKFRDACVEFTSGSSFYDFWDEQKRPAAWIVLGHLESDRIGLMPMAVASIPDQWLSPKTIMDYLVEYGPWEQPNPMILLMACESGKTQLSDLNGFVQAFHATGASAIVGTECPIFSGIAALFAQEIVLKLWNEKTNLGEAVQSFNREMFCRNIPLPFVFSCIGSSDLKVVLSEGG